MTKPKGSSTPPVDHYRIAQECRDHPGTWVRVTVYRSRYVARSMLSTIEGGRSNANIHAYVPPGAFEARTEPVEDGWQVYAKYTSRP